MYVVVFSNFDKSSSITKAPVAALGAEAGAELLSFPLPPSPWPWQGAPRGLCGGSVPFVPVPSRCLPSCAVIPPEGAAPPRWGQVAPATLTGWGQPQGPVQSRIPAPVWQHGWSRSGPSRRRCLTRATATSCGQSSSLHPCQGGQVACPLPLLPRESWGAFPPPVVALWSQGRQSPQRSGCSLPAMETLPARSLSFPTLIFFSDRSFSR